jgi:hypothetical protein
MAAVDDRIDALYALPPEAFTPARNALAKTLSGDEAKRVKALKKPTGVPWAVNQLYWNDRRAFSRVMDLGRALRKAQVAALEGKKADVREASARHREAVAAGAARAAALATSAKVGAKADAVARMLEAVSLAREEPADLGRFTDVLQPAAFDAIAGIAPRAALKEIKKEGRDDRETKRHEQEAREAAREQAALAVEEAERTAGRARDTLEFARKRLKAAEAGAEEANEALADARKRLAELPSP